MPSEQSLESALYPSALVCRVTDKYNQISKDFERFVDDLEEQYQQAEHKKQQSLEDSNLLIMKSVAKEFRKRQPTINQLAFFGANMIYVSFNHSLNMNPT